jgi:hypothetical protein
MNSVSTKARMVANIFDVLAWCVAGLGVLGAALVFIGGIGSNDFWVGLITAVGILVYAAISWAGITLASVVAGYIEHRS